jgi:beta-glucosidase
MVAAMQKTLLALGFSSMFLAMCALRENAKPAALAAATQPSYRDPSLPLDRRVADLLGRMTLAEKVAQLEAVNWDHTKITDEKSHLFSPEAAHQFMANGIGQVTRIGSQRSARQATDLANAVQHFLVEHTRLGIPAIIHEEALHGFVGEGATSFPQAIALAATFDPALVENVFTVAARQMRARGATQALAPVVDVARDPRWGRIEETYGEDPYLVSRMGVAAIQGFQGKRASEDAPIDAEHVLATVKHFTGHGTPEGGRNTAPGNYSERVLREVFLPPFEAAVREAHVGSLMASYNEVDGLPSHANKWLLSDVLRGELGFRGLLVSDYFGVAELDRKHHVVADLAEAGRRALEAGVDVELPEPEGYSHLADEATAGRVPIAAVDRAVTHVLRAKLMLGLFEHPFVDVAQLKPETVADRALAKRAAEEAIVLLKNDGNLLPLDASRLGSIAVIGPNAAVCRLGGYSNRPERAVSVVEGLRAKLGAKVKVLGAEGCSLTTAGRGWGDDAVELGDPRADDGLIAQAGKLAASANVVLLVLGQTEQLSREAWADNHRGDRMTLDLMGRQMDLARAVLAAKKPTVLLLIHGSPLSIPELAKSVPAILDGFYLGEETGGAVADILFGDVSPSGKLPVSVPRNVGSLPAYYNYKPSARRLYLFEEPGPLWSFGYGLSYASFRYDELGVTPSRIAPDGHAAVSVNVTNTGKRAADEVVTLYVHDVVSSVTRPVRELKGFRRVHLDAGQTAKVELPVGPAELSFYDEHMKRIVEPGEFEITVGASGVEPLKATLQVAAP